VFSVLTVLRGWRFGLGPEMKRYRKHPVAPPEPYHTVGVAYLWDRAADQLVAQLPQFIAIEIVDSLSYFLWGRLGLWRNPERGERLKKVWIVLEHPTP
jgi:hypothetical protein